MAGKVRYLIQRGGRYHARIVVPKALRSTVGKTELSLPLGADRQTALRRLPASVAALQDQLDRARAKVGQGNRPIANRSRSLDAEEIARIHYGRAIAFDTELRNTDPRFAAGFVDEDYVGRLRTVVIGSATNDEISDTLGLILEYFRKRRNHAHAPGSPEWRNLARSLAQAELDALAVTAARDDGDPDPVPTAFPDAPLEASAPPRDHPRVGEIFDGYRAELQAAGKWRNADTRWLPVIGNLISFLAHDRSERITRHDALRWKDHLLKSFAPKTVRDHYFAIVRSAFRWAVDNDLVETNPFANVKVIVGKARLTREKGFNDDEALAVIKAALAYRGTSRREQAPMVAAKRWTPILGAYTGARIAELTQLRAEDVRTQGGINFIRITPEAGSVKSGAYRDVPLNAHLIDLGFLAFVKSVEAGPLFYRQGKRTGAAHPSKMVADRVGKWIRSLGIAEASVQPNHGWRHRLKTVARDCGIDARTIDAIQGHAPRTAGEAYGDVSLKAKQAAIEGLPRFPI